MKAAPLQLCHYFVPQAGFGVTPSFEPEKPMSLQASSLRVESRCERATDPAAGWQWQVIVGVEFKPTEGENAPYGFSVEIVGLFDVVEQYPAEKAEQLVRTNGSTMLYGMTREIVRDMTSRGPHPPVILPSASFYPDAPPPAETSVAEPTGPGAQSI